MKRAAAIFSVLFTLLVGPLCPESPGTKARIEKRGKLWMLDKGESSGVSVGLTGYFMKRTYSVQDKKMIQQQVAHFKVTRVKTGYCFAVVDQWIGGHSAEDAEFAQFDKQLVPPPGSRRKSSELSRIEAGKTSRWYLEKGDEAARLENYGQAMEYYERVLEKDPDDPGAKIKYRGAQGKYFVQQGDLDYKQGKHAIAYEYYVGAYLILREDAFIAAEKILAVWGQDEDFYNRSGEYEISPAEILHSLTRYCKRLLEENRLARLAALARKMKPFARDDELKNKLDTWMTAKEIQADLAEAKFKALTAAIETSLDENNLYRAAYIIDKLDKRALDDESRARLNALKEKSRAKGTQVKIERGIKLKEEKIKTLAAEAHALAAVKKYEEAVARYMEICKMEPDNQQHREKLNELQEEKFKYEQRQKRIDAEAKRNELILYAEDRAQKELVQDALDYYIKAYKILPEEGKAIAGIAAVLEKCSENDAAFITATLLGRKLTKFCKDFLNHIEKEYVGAKDEQGFAILVKIFHLVDSQEYRDLKSRLKANVYAKYLQAGHERFTNADFVAAAARYQDAQLYGDTAEVEPRLAVCSRLAGIKDLLAQERKKELDPILDGIPTLENWQDMVSGLLYLSEKYLEEYDFKTARFLYKRAANWGKRDFKERLKAWKEKEKALKQEAKEKKKKKSGLPLP